MLHACRVGIINGSVCATGGLVSVVHMAGFLFTFFFSSNWGMEKPHAKIEQRDCKPSLIRKAPQNRPNTCSTCHHCLFFLSEKVNVPQTGKNSLFP